MKVIGQEQSVTLYTLRIDIGQRRRSAGDCALAAWWILMLGATPAIDICSSKQWGLNTRIGSI